MIKRSLFLVLLISFVSVSEAQQIPKWKMDDVVRSFTQKNDTVYVVNFWATFCKPCIAEIPDFIRIVEKYRSQKVKLLLVSLDIPAFYPQKIAGFAKKNNYNTNIVWLNETNADHFCPMIDMKWSGAIPATIIVNNKTGYRKFVEDQISAADFEASIKSAIGGNAFNKYHYPMNDADINDNSSLAETGPGEYMTFRSKDSAVYSIMEGKVSVIARIDDMKIAIIENNGLYYTYSNLRSILVKKGDVIKTDQVIGYAAPEMGGTMPLLDLYVSNSERNLLLTKKDFIPRNDKRLLDHSIEFQFKEPQ